MRIYKCRGCEIESLIVHPLTMIGLMGVITDMSVEGDRVMETSLVTRF